MPKMNNGWTGGQYSVFRMLFGLYLCVHFLTLLPWGREMFSSEGVIPNAVLSPLTQAFPNILRWVDGPAFVGTFLLIAAVASICLALGWRDRLAAVVAWYVLACLYGRNPLIANPSLPFVGWMLLAHAVLPSAPYGSLAARGRIDPGNGWRFPPELFAAVWIIMSVAYTYSGITKLVSPSWVDGTAFYEVLRNPLARASWLRDFMMTLPSPLLLAASYGGLALELLFVPLALFSRTRPLAWLAMAGMHIGLVALISFGELSTGMLLLHLFTFNPSWVKGVRTGIAKAARDAHGHDTVFYDGGCGLCHGAIRFLLAEDVDGARFHYAPLGGDAFEAQPLAMRIGLPDSIVIVRSDGGLYVRSQAILYAMQRLGGLWRLLAIALGILPTRFLDWCYDGVASVRHRLFPKPDDACPILPKELRARFMA